MVRRTLFWNDTGSPLDTQSAVVASPRYSVLGFIRLKSSNVYVLLWQTGSGVQELSENEDRGSHPPRQYAPTPHCPYSASRYVSQLHFLCRDLESYSREQQGVALGHLLPRLQLGASAIAAVAKANAAKSDDVRTIIIFKVVEDRYWKRNQRLGRAIGNPTLDEGLKEASK